MESYRKLKNRERITAINEHTEQNNTWDKQAGYIIKTTENEYLFLIDDDQSCCEEYGYFASEDDLQQYVDSDLLKIYLTDTALKTYDIDLTENEWDCKDTMFVNIETNVGTLQLVLYNIHNGYYGHNMILKKNGIKIH